MDKRNIIIIVLAFIVLALFFSPSRCGVIRYREQTKDTTIYNVEYRDSVVYHFEHKDSTIIDYNAVPLTKLKIDTIRDTTFVYVPITSYHFADSMADVWASGYRVTLDSVRYHFHEVTKTIEREVIKKPRIFFIDAGLMMYMGGSLNLDLTADMRLGDRWSLRGVVAISTIDGLSPVAGVGVRYRIR